MSRLTTRHIAGAEELVAHFDRVAPEYVDTHGHRERLRRYRLAIIERLLGDVRRGTLLEIGCGRAIHLIPLAAGFERAVGTDVSAEMVRMARAAADASAWSARIELRVDPAERLDTIGDGSVDAVVCVGAIEHMLDRAGALTQVRRVLAPGGIFVCLTPNGGYCWYRVLAPLLRRDTRHLSTDRFLTAGELRELVRAAGLAPQASEHWRFIPKGDLPTLWGAVLHGLDYAGRVAHAGPLRGGLALSARPSEDAPNTGAWNARTASGAPAGSTENSAPTARVAVWRRRDRVHKESALLKAQPQRGPDRNAGLARC